MNYSQLNALTIYQITPAIVDLVIPLLDKHFPNLRRLADLSDQALDDIFDEVEFIIGFDLEIKDSCVTLFRKMVDGYLRLRFICKQYPIDPIPTPNKSIKDTKGL